MQKTHNGLVIGVTGGIGSGKTEVCRIFSQLGALVVYADDLAKEIMETNSDVKGRIEAFFGKDAYGANGKLRRKKLAALVFGNEKLRKKINAIVHPYVLEILREIIHQKLFSRRNAILVIEAALLYESGANHMMDYTIVVNADEDTRVDRVVRRDGTTRQEVLLRLKAQLPAAEKIRKSDFVIHNDGDLRSLEEKVAFIHKLLLLQLEGKQEDHDFG